MTISDSEDERRTASRHGGPTDRVILCPRCKVRAHQIWSRMYEYPPGRNTQVFWDEAESDRWQDGEHIPVSQWFSAHCQGCDQKTLWRNEQHVYPATSVAPTPHPQMSADVKTLFEEAGRVLPLSRRAGAALVRAALEKQVKLLDTDAPQGSRLDDHIARLSTRVSRSLGELLDVIRHVGNAALHGADDDDLVYMFLSDSDGADDIAELLFDAINDLVDELVTRPQAASSLWDRLPSGVRENIQRKRDAQQP